MPSDKKVIALRLEDQTRRQVEAYAAQEMRSVSNMAEILIRYGLREMDRRLAASKGSKK